MFADRYTLVPAVVILLGDGFNSPSRALVNLLALPHSVRVDVARSLLRKGHEACISNPPTLTQH